MTGSAARDAIVKGLVGVCLLPASLAYAGGLGNWLRRLRRPQAFLAEVADHSSQIMEKLKNEYWFPNLLIQRALYAGCILRETNSVRFTIRKCRAVFREKTGYCLATAARTLPAFVNIGELCKDPKHDLRILFISHDAALAGAQILLLYLLRWFKRHTSVDCRLLLLNNGPLRRQYEACCPVALVKAGDICEKKLAGFCENPDLILGNTSVAAECYDSLKTLKTPIITYIHELEQSLRKFTSPLILDKMKRFSAGYIAANKLVKNNLRDNHGIAEDGIIVVDAFLEPVEASGPIDKIRLRRDLGLPKDGSLILGCGSLDWRKGPDLFVEVAKRVLGRHPGERVYFCWVGSGSDERIPDPVKLARAYGLTDRIIFAGWQFETSDFFKAADIFILTSREDPFPLVALEACDHKLPVICFENSGGMPEFVKTGPGLTVPYEDVEAMAEALHELLTDVQKSMKIGETARKRLLESHTSDIAAPRILNFCRTMAQKPPPVSVIVPNYNYEEYLNERLGSIFNQTFKDLEVIILDDASSDSSLAVIEGWREFLRPKIIVNEKNSGRLASQWEKGIEIAEGTYIWIAEADDTCDREFLAAVLKPMKDDKVVLAYALPRVIDEYGALAVNFDYRDSYLKFAGAGLWDSSHVLPGEDMICGRLGIINCIPNISAAVFRKDACRPGLEAAKDFHCSADWALYLHLALEGKVAYVHGDMANHRRHPQSVVAKDLNAKRRILFNEAETIHRWVRSRFSLSGDVKAKQSAFLDNILDT